MANQTLQLAELSAVEAVARMSRGELRAESYAHALIARCETAHALNAFITLEPERVLVIGSHDVLDICAELQPPVVPFALDMHLDCEKWRVVNPYANLFDRSHQHVALAVLP